MKTLYLNTSRDMPGFTFADTVSSFPPCERGRSSLRLQVSPLAVVMHLPIVIRTSDETVCVANTNGFEIIGSRYYSIAYADIAPELG